MFKVKGGLNGLRSGARGLGFADLGHSART